MKNLISVIVPVYNVEDYLPRCLDSIAAQTHRNLEVILVDDGSTDTSGAICDTYAARDPRFKVIHQENKWLARARNAGIEAASGSFLYFVDGDDAIHPRLLERMLKVYEEQDCDYVICGHRREYALTEPFGVDELPPTPVIEEIPATSVIDHILQGDIEDNFFGISWNKLIPRHLAEGLRFADIYGNEDIALTLPLALRSKKICIIKEPLYHYTQRTGSIMHGSWEKWMLYHMRMRVQSLDLLPEEDARHRGIALKKLYRRMLSGTANEAGSEYEADFHALCKEILRKTRKEYYRHPGIGTGEKALFTFLWWNRWGLRLVSRQNG